jgi:lysine 2,3-aminomutase
VTRYYRALADERDPADPVARQFMPDPAELRDADAEPDPLAEERDMPVPGLIRRYPDRALLITTARCAVHCRHCMRKRYWRDAPGDLSEAAERRAVEYVAATPAIREVILSGGDPLMLPPDRLCRMVRAFAGIPRVEVIRIGSRIPVVQPSLLTTRRCRDLAAAGPVWFATHFNHPRELTPQAARAAANLLKAGIPVVNQTVLLKGINDSENTLEELFRGLLRIGVKPYYLFHGDPIRGTGHFRTGIARGLELMSRLRGRLSGLALPAYAFDLPGGGGKVRLEPDCFRGTDARGNPVFADLAGTARPYPDPQP